MGIGLAKKSYFWLIKFFMISFLRYNRQGLLWLLLTILVIGGCKKPTATDPVNVFQQYFDANILNQNFIVILATDHGNDITANYNGYSFKLIKTDYYHGPIEMKYGTMVYSGSWLANEDYSKLTINLPSTPSLFIFLTREWRFTSKNIPELDLAPWGSTDPIVLHILRQ